MCQLNAFVVQLVERLICNQIGRLFESHRKLQVQSLVAHLEERMTSNYHTRGVNPPTYGLKINNKIPYMPAISFNSIVSQISIYCPTAYKLFENQFVFVEGFSINSH